MVFATGLYASRSFVSGEGNATLSETIDARLLPARSWRPLLGEEEKKEARNAKMCVLARSETEKQQTKGTRERTKSEGTRHSFPFPRGAKSSSRCCAVS